MLTHTLILSQESEGEDFSGAGAQAVEDVTNWWQTSTAQEWLVEIPVKLLIILLVALVLHGLARRLIDRAARTNIAKGGKPTSIRFRGKAKKADEVDTRVQAQLDAREHRRKSRVRTLASVAKSAVAIVIWVWAGMAALSLVGVNIGPLVASAGVIGVALGFGAQSLVKDFLSGIFMLLEDQYGVGDTIDVGGDIVGDVEDISLRITTIRDIDGTLWYVRNGEIERIGNLSDEYSIARLQIPVGLSNDTEKAWEVILNSVNEGVTAEKIRNVILEEPTMNGVTDFQPDYLSYRISVKTLPGQQWDVQRYLQAKVLNDMRAAGISTPYPNGIGGPARESFDRD